MTTMRTIFIRAFLDNDGVPSAFRQLPEPQNAASGLPAQINDAILSPPRRGLLGINVMAKERKRGNREAKKPKQAPKPAAAAPAVFAKGLSPDIGKSKKT